MFFNETELTELRLRELEPAVDEFVVVEAAYTHTNKPKDFLFGKEVASGKYDGILKRLHYVTVPRFPEGLTSLQRENFQRNQILQGLSGLEEDDIVMVSDCDEIPSALTVSRLQTDLWHLNREDPRVVPQDYYCYYLNCKTPHPWKGTVALHGRDISHNRSLQWFRDRKDKFMSFGRGWHFGYLGGLDKIQTKLVSFLHEEFSNLPEEYIAAKLEKKEDLYQNVPFEVVSLDGLPSYVRNNPDKFQHLIHPYD